MSRDLFAAAALADIPKILTLQDRNPHSPTYGCFDRNYWQYKIIDFPSGMAQEFVYPLALAWAIDCPGNPYHGKASIRDWAIAGMRFAAASAHSDGSCDDYFPYERAAGAAAFSLLACLDAYRLLGLRDDALEEFFARRGAWLADHRESGRLSNHEALIALDLALLGELDGGDRWQASFEARLARLLSWQDEEGWFQEYEGCDPGYLTLTISVLARLHEMQPREDLARALERAVAFAAEFSHPDGSYGGEYGSRNTYNFFPHGFELVGRWMPAALAVNDRFLEALAAGRAACYADDHIVGHHCWNYLLAWRDFRRPAPRHGTLSGTQQGRRVQAVPRRPARRQRYPGLVAPERWPQRSCPSRRHLRDAACRGRNRGRRRFRLGQATDDDGRQADRPAPADGYRRPLPPGRGAPTAAAAAHYRPSCGTLRLRPPADLA
jgi:hypothetical protein